MELRQQIDDLMPIIDWIEEARIAALSQQESCVDALEELLHIGFEDARDYAQAVGVFSSSEMCSALDIKPTQARRLIAEMEEKGTVQPAGRAMSKPLYAWVRPDDPGEAFANQTLRAVESPEIEAQRLSTEYGIKQARSGSQKQDIVGAITTPEVRAVAREARQEGWVISRTGTDHFQARKGNRVVRFAGTPRSGGAAAMHLRRDLGLRRAS